jgi:hypothetical protein
MLQWSTRMLQEYVVNVSSVLHVCCNKCLMLQVFYEQAREVGATEVVPLGAAVPVHMGIKEARWVLPPRACAATGTCVPQQ